MISFTYPGDNLAMVVENFFSRRLLLVTGKGGVGKSTTCAALALVAARLDKKVLLVEINSSGRLWQYFNTIPLDDQEIQIRQNIFALNLDPHQVLQKYIIDHTPLKMLAHKIVNSPIYRYFVAALPGIKEIMALGKIMLLEREKRYDIIIADIPATGYGLSLLKVPQVVLNTVEKGPVNFQTRRVHNLLKDPHRTLLNIVTSAEEMAIKEALEIYHKVNGGSDIALGYVFINGLYPPLPTDKTLEIYQSIKDSMPDTYNYLRCTDFTIQRRFMHEYYLKEFRRDTSCHNIVEIPFIFSANFDLAALEEISNCLKEKLCS